MNAGQEKQPGHEPRDEIPAYLPDRPDHFLHTQRPVGALPVPPADDAKAKEKKRCREKSDIQEDVQPICFFVGASTTGTQNKSLGFASTRRTLHNPNYDTPTARVTTIFVAADGQESTIQE